MLALAMTMLIGLVVSATVLVGQVATVRHRADGAADLAALAAARVAQTGGNSCAAAADIAAANGARLLSCVHGWPAGGPRGGDVTVRVSVAGTALGDRTLTAVAQARAGQVTP